MKLLIVEDEHKVVDYLRSGLTEQGWVVDVALDGEEGMHLATEFDYDVIVLDVMLPKRDGFSVLKALRMRKSTPVIMLTARDHVNDRSPNPFRFSNWSNGCTRWRGARAHRNPR